MRPLRKEERPVVSRLLIVLALVSATARADEVEVSRDRFDLWNGCHPMALFVAPLDGDDHARKIGLTTGMVTAAVRGRPHAASLFDRTAPTWLDVAVTVVGAAFSVNLQYLKPFHDRLSDEWGWAVTWQTRASGLHGRDADYVLSSVARHTDRFIDEFRRVNGEACGN